MRAYRRHKDRVAKARKIRVLKAQGWRRYWPKKTWKSMRRLAMTTPCWWTHEHMILPMRVESNQQLRLVEKGFPPDLFQWPDGKRPHVYYW